MPSQRIILGIGLAILLVIGAASVGLNLQSRSDSAQADRSVGMLRKIMEMRLSLHRAETTSGRFTLAPVPEVEKLYRESAETITAQMADLVASSAHDNPGRTRILEEAEKLIAQRLALSDEMVRIRASGDTVTPAAMAKRAEGFALINAINEKLDKIVADERQVLSERNDHSRSNSLVLLTIDLAGVALILLLAVMLMATTRRSSRELQDSLTATQATNEALEAAVAERTEHLVEAHAELRLSATVIRSTFHSMAEAVLVIDNKGEVLLSNPAAERMLRYRPGTTVGLLRSMSSVFHADGVTPLPASEMPASRALRGEEFDAIEIVVRPVGGTTSRHLVISGRPLRDAAGDISGAALVYHDITASRETEHKLLQSQKLDAIGKLTGGVAHDFNNMLTVITGTTETLVAGLAEQPSLQKTAELIDQAAERCSELIQHLLAFARRQPLHPRNVDINSTVLDIAKLLRPTLGEQIEVTSVLEPKVATAHVDASQLANSILNMAINARDAMPDGGKLLLETCNVVLDDAYAQANPEVQPGSYVMLAVSDTGAGMSPEVLDQVFEPFFTTKEVGKGTGLGLSMVYGFVKQSGGHIRIYSEVGHGTTVKLYLPPAQGQIELAPPAPAPAAQGNEVILVVEDDALVRNFVTVQLQSLGYRTVAAADGPSAMALIENGEAFDLLFTDVIMPGGMTGRQLADKAAKLRPGLKVLYTSGYTDNAIIHQGQLNPGVLLLSKPYRKSQLAGMIRRALSG
ncbi:MAG: ATP-binding protein [bacterium]|nr:ATP-binding protein [bacterium]